MQKTLGGDRLGSGSKQKVTLHNYERSTHDMGYLWRSTMAAGTLVPFMSEVGLPGDTFDINLACEMMTHPTIGPLFGSYKVQLDIFQAPIRLYQAKLHNNKLGIGMDMASVKLPLMKLEIPEFPNPLPIDFDLDNSQISPSCILSYLGIRGVGFNATGDPVTTREFNAIPLLAYWDIYKNYYANKQEEIGAVIHTGVWTPANETVDQLTVNSDDIPEAPATTAAQTLDNPSGTAEVTSLISNATQILLITETGQIYRIEDLFYNALTAGLVISYSGYKSAQYGTLRIVSWRYMTAQDNPPNPISVTTFPLTNLDDMRESILNTVALTTAFVINGVNIDPYQFVIGEDNGENSSKQYTQEGLGLKTYQSDLFNNWLSTEWIDGSGGINEITAIDTSGGSFNIDTLNLSKKVYDMLNRIAVSGGTYDDWLDAVYTHDRVQRAETPIYHGGLIRELVFQEVVSNAASAVNSEQPLGTLAGKGIMSGKKKGGNVTVKVDEPSYIIGIISLTPRIDYSQGNKWDVHLLTMDDLHKPALDEIGFQELITEQMAWWSTEQTVTAGEWVTKSAGKQPAWINYMTNVNQTRGNFAIGTDSAVGEMFMTLNRRYEIDPGTSTILDLTTYIDPSKFNAIFAQTSIDSQNFWAQIAVDITARRKISAKVMPNL